MLKTRQRYLQYLLDTKKLLRPLVVTGNVIKFTFPTFTELQVNNNSQSRSFIHFGDGLGQHTLDQAIILKETKTKARYTNKVPKLS